MDMLRDPQYKTAEGSALRMWRDTAQNRYLTEQQGRPIFDEVIYVEVIAPGSGNSTPVFELERIFDPLMNHPDPLRGPKYEELKQFIEDFKKNEDGDASLAGTPLAEWPQMNRTLVAALRAQGVYTVEALAAVPDGKLNIIGPDGRTWRAKADAYIKAAQDGGYATQLAAKVEELIVDRNAGAEREKALAARIAELESASAAGTPAPPSKAAKTTNAKAEAPAAVAAGDETLVASTGGTKAEAPII